MAINPSTPYRQNPTFPQQGSDRSYQEDRHRQIEAAVSKPPPPAAYRGLRYGPEFSIEYEPNVAQALGIDKSLLRKLSPFILQIEPPQVFGEDGGYTSAPKKTNPNAYTQAGLLATSPYESARDRLSQTALVGLDYRVSSGQESVVANSSSGRRNKNATDTPKDDEGNSAGRLGVPAIADVYTAVDIATQLSAVLNAPPLVLLLNPDNMVMTYTKVQQFQDRSRFGFIFHGWGEEQPRLSITAKCGAFMTGGRGLQFASKRDSAAWQNLMSAFHFYKNNGYIHDTIGRSNAHHFVGALSLHYDQWIYYGHMESFNFTYDEGKQHGGIEFAMEFVISMMVDTSPSTLAVSPMKSPIPSLSDPRYMGMDNRPSNKAGEFSVDFNDGLTTQGRSVSAEDSLLTMVPEGFAQTVLRDSNFRVPSATEAGTQRGTLTQDTGSAGFQAGVPDMGGSRPVNQILSGQRVRPFRR